MDTKAKAVIAAVPAIDPSVGKDGPTLGFNAANAISDALESAGYKVIHNDDLKKIREGMESVLASLGSKA